MNDTLDDGYGGTLARKCQEGLAREGKARKVKMSKEVENFKKWLELPAEAAFAAPPCSGALEFDVELAIALSRYVHENCSDVNHDIGIHLARIVFEHQRSRPVLPND